MILFLFWNFLLSLGVWTSNRCFPIIKCQDGDRFWRMPECYIRGNTIKYLRVPDEVFMKTVAFSYCLIVWCLMHQSTLHITCGCGTKKSVAFSSFPTSVTCLSAASHFYFWFLILFPLFFDLYFYNFVIIFKLWMWSSRHPPKSYSIKLFFFFLMI